MSKQADVEFLFILALENYAKTSGTKIKSDKKIAATKQAVHKNPSDYKTPEDFGALKVAEHN